MNAETSLDEKEDDELEFLHPYSGRNFLEMSFTTGYDSTDNETRTFKVEGRTGVKLGYCFDCTTDSVMIGEKIFKIDLPSDLLSSNSAKRMSATKDITQKVIDQRKSTNFDAGLQLGVSKTADLSVDGNQFNEITNENDQERTSE